MHCAPQFSGQSSFGTIFLNIKFFWSCQGSPQFTNKCQIAFQLVGHPSDTLQTSLRHPQTPSNMSIIMQYRALYIYIYAKFYVFHKNAYVWRCLDYVWGCLDGVWMVSGSGLRVSGDVLIPNLLANKLY